MEMTRVEKGWGEELWIVNKPEYCGKILHFNEGGKCSYHYHKLKDETFYIHRGIIKLLYGWEDDLSKAAIKILHPGDRFHVQPGLRHQIIALTEADIIEFSTEHFEEDSYRVAPGDSQK